MHNSKILFCTVSLSLCFGLGCTLNHVAEHAGDAVAANNASMIADPNAGREVTDGVVQFEGSTVEGTMSRYRKTQQKAASQGLPGSILKQEVSQ